MTPYIGSSCGPRVGTGTTLQNLCSHLISPLPTRPGGMDGTVDSRPRLLL